MDAFWAGFEKQAGNDVIGQLKNVRSGLESSESGKISNSNDPTSGVSIGARATPPPVPSPQPIKGENPGLELNTGGNKSSQPKMPKIQNKNKSQTGSGVSDMKV